MAVAAVSLAPRSSATLPPAEIYAKAEQWFDSLEKQGGEVPVDSVTNLADGYYNR